MRLFKDIDYRFGFLCLGLLVFHFSRLSVSRVAVRVCHVLHSGRRLVLALFGSPSRRRDCVGRKDNIIKNYHYKLQVNARVDLRSFPFIQTVTNYPLPYRFP